MRRPGTAARQPWAHYVVALVVGALLTIPMFAGLIVVLDRAGAMPPPLISNNLCVDDKLAFMRRNKPRNVNLLVAGSSSAMRHFNSPAAVRMDPTLRPFNAGFCAINLAQSARVIDWLTPRLPKVRRVLLFASSIEFGDCGFDGKVSLNIADADRFVFSDASRLSFYLEFFNATTLLRNAIGLRRRRTDITLDDAIALNKFGDGPVDPPGDRRAWYLEPSRDSRCFTTLRRTAQELGARGIQFAVVESPMSPKWRQEFDPTGTVTALTRRKIRRALSGTNAVLIEDHSGFSSADFYDATHVRASSTPRFTRSVLSQLEALDRGLARPAR